MTRTFAIALAVIALVVVGGFIAYDQVLRGDSADALAFPSAPASSAAPANSVSPTGSTATSAPTTSSSASEAPEAPAASDDGSVAGTWTITTGSEAGYRVREQLANLPAESDAVGRTTQVVGTITVATDGSTSTLTAGEITVDTTSITSDEDRRDNRLRREGLETDTYPTATFTLTAPVEIPAAAIDGTATDLTLTGDLTLHGVTRAVSIPAQARLADGTIQVLGSLPISLADYSITAPNIGGFIVSIADEGTLEFVAVFAKG